MGSKFIIIAQVMGKSEQLRIIKGQQISRDKMHLSNLYLMSVLM